MTVHAKLLQRALRGCCHAFLHSRSAVPHCDQKRHQFGPVDDFEHALLIWVHLETQVCILVFSTYS